MDKEKLEFYLVKEPQFELISEKEVLESLKRLIKALKSLIHFLLPLTKEKSLYNTVFTKKLEIGGVVFSKLNTCFYPPH